MSLVDSVVPHLQQRTTRGDEVQRLLEALLTEIRDPARGGLAGFLGHFSAAGFSALVHSWLAHDPYAIASAAQVRYALGDALLIRLAREADLSTGTAAMLLASMIPRVVYRLTPGGRVPSVRELHDLMDGQATPAASARAEIREQTQQQWQQRRQQQQHRQWEQPRRPSPPAVVSAVAPTGVAASGRRWIQRLRTPVFLYGAPIVWLLLIAVAAWWSLRGDAHPSAAGTAGRAASPATLVLRHAEHGVITASGVLPDATTRELVVGELRHALPASDWGADFAIDPGTARPVWLAGLTSLVSLVRETSGAEVRLTGDRIALGGTLSERERARLREQLAGIFGRSVSDLADVADRRE